MTAPPDPPATHDPSPQEIEVAYLASVVEAAELRAVEAQARLRAARIAWGRAQGLDDPGDGYEALWVAKVKGSGGAP